MMFYGPANGWYAIVLAATGVGASELFGMTHPADKVSQAVGVITSLCVSLTLYLAGSDARVLLTLLAAVTIVGALVPLWRLGRIEDAALRIMAGIAGPLYIGGLLTTLALLRRDQGASVRATCSSR